jgi:uncharacterized membrane protein
MLVRRGAHPESFAWWLAASASVMYLPLGAYLFWTVGLPSEGIPFVIATGVIHSFYFVLLGRAYEHGDLGLVYPLARGTGPLLVPAIAVPLLGERLTPLGATGIACILIGVVTLQAGGFRPAALKGLVEATRHPAARYALATGVTIALYSVNDKAGVRWVDPLLYGYVLFLGASILAAPYFWIARRGATVACWRANRRSIVLAGLISPLTYFMALVAFQLGQVSYLAPMREVSIVIAAALGTLVLGERFSRARLTSAAITALGVVLIGLGA